MKLRQSSISTFHLPLIRALKINDQRLTSRQGVIVQLITDNDLRAFGEAAPLAGLHTEVIKDVLEQLAPIQQRLNTTHIPGISDIPCFLNDLLPQKDWLPTARFALESALMSLYLQSNPQAVGKTFLPQHHENILVNALIYGKQAQVLTAVKRNLAAGYLSLKLKVGRYPVAHDIEMVRSVCCLLKGKARLRLDANRAWNLATATRFLEEIGDCPLEYIEEPLEDPAELELLFNRTGAAIALDESIGAWTFDRLFAATWIKALVLKPTVIGSLADTFRFIRAAEEKKLMVVISDTFQSGVGLSFLIRIAASLKERIAMGFDTYQYLGEDILQERIKVQNGIIELKQVMIQQPLIDKNRLQAFSASHSGE
jgi:o-succinylbenzoate synthase